MTASTLLLQLPSWAILVLALRGLEAGAGNVTVTWTEALAAFSFARVASFIPITPGGLGTVDAALAALLTGFGATTSQALATDLVWRAASYVPQVLLGALTFLWWRVSAARRRQRVIERSQSGSWHCWLAGPRTKGCPSDPLLAGEEGDPYRCVARVAA